MIATEFTSLPARGAQKRRRRRLIEATFMTLVVVTATVGFLGAQLAVSGIIEGYCLVWPSIGTRFAPGFSEENFDRVTRGMTPTEVNALLGVPLDTRGRRNQETWSYSSDSSARGGDWAWLAREVVFDDRRVVETTRRIYYD